MFGEEYRDSESNRHKYRCRICDKFLESFGFVCDECRKRDDEFIEQDTYLEFVESEDAAYRQLTEERETMATAAGGAKAGPETKRKSYKM